MSESQNLTNGSIERAHKFSCFPLTEEDSLLSSHRFKTSNELLGFSASSSPCHICKDTVAMFIFVPTALLRAQLTTDKYAACQKEERWQPGTAKHRDRRVAFSHLVSRCLSERGGTKFASMGGQEGGSHSPPLRRPGTQTPSLTWKGSPFILQCCASMLQRQ